MENSSSGVHQLAHLSCSSPDSRLVPALVARHALSNPDGLAVASSAETLSFGALEQRANALANVLHSLGVVRETLVATFLGRSPAAVTAQLAILKTGGAYLPLDPDYPRQRISFMLDNAQPKVVLSCKQFIDRLPAGTWAHLDIDESTTSDDRWVAPPVCDSDIDSLAYVIYTSGSTGRPKGVQITQRGLLNLIHWHQHTFNVTTADRATHMASIGFDAAVWEVWSHLTAGCPIYIPDDDTRMQPELLRDFIVTHGITISFVATPLAERMLELPWPAETRLRVLLTGADVLHLYPPPHLPFVLVNNYGPTETTVVATSGFVSAAERLDIRPTIGRPIANVYIRILDGELNEVPQGETGEIYIGGEGVGRGYLGDEELTAAAFIRDPFSSDTERRLYRTGDLGRYLPDGNIAFLGRSDDLVKIRGYRIDPNEIVTVLDAHPAIQSSAVIGDKDGNGDARLVGYIVPQPGIQISDSLLRSHLAAQLPTYMVPAAFVCMESMPLTANGKVDRSVLPKPNDNNILRDDCIRQPCTTVETRLSDIVASLLQLRHVGVDDNFFYIGGHSLLGTQLIARVRNAFGVELPLRSIFDRPTVTQLAREIEQAIVTKLEAMTPQPTNIIPPVPPAGV